VLTAKQMGPGLLGC